MSDEDPIETAERLLIEAEAERMREMEDKAARGAAKGSKTVVSASLPTGETVQGIVRAPGANLAERAIKTLGQAFVGTFTVVFFGAQSTLNMTGLKAAAVAAGSATLAALLSLVQNMLFGKVPS